MNPKVCQKNQITQSKFFYFLTFNFFRDDPLVSCCLLCYSYLNLIKYKDMKLCNSCKSYWKGRRLNSNEACSLFCLQPEDLSSLPYKELSENNNEKFFAFSTIAGAAVKRYGSLYDMACYKSMSSVQNSLLPPQSDEKFIP